MPCVRYTLEQVFMCNNYVKNGSVRKQGEDSGVNLLRNYA